MVGHGEQPDMSQYPGVPLALPLLLNLWVKPETGAGEPDKACLASLPKYLGLSLAPGAIGENDTNDRASTLNDLS